MRVLLCAGEPFGDNPVAANLELLGHDLTHAPLDPGTAPAAGTDVAVVDASGDLGRAAAVCRALAANPALPVLVAAPESGMAVLKMAWGFDDWFLRSAQPAEIETRLRLAADRSREAPGGRTASVGDLSIDEDTYVVRLRGRPLDLTYREFELLKHLASNPRLVFTRAQLLKEVWGYDYFGGTRTVDVHIRRLRAKLGAEHEQLIETVRGVGYKLDPHGVREDGAADGDQAGDASTSSS